MTGSAGPRVPSCSGPRITLTPKPKLDHKAQLRPPVHDKVTTFISYTLPLLVRPAVQSSRLPKGERYRINRPCRSLHCSSSSQRKVIKSHRQKPITVNITTNERDTTRVRAHILKRRGNKGETAGRRVACSRPVVLLSLGASLSMHQQSVCFT